MISLENIHLRSNSKLDIVLTAILCLRKQQINGKFIIQLVLAYKMLSNHVVNYGTNFLNTLYVILHHANVFIEDNIYGIKVVPLTTLLIMKTGTSDARYIIL